jgi:hypothetical protein
MTTTLDKRAEDLVIAILAELAMQNIDTLHMSDRKFHEHFGRVLERLREVRGELGELARQFYKNVVTDTYDELDHSLITAEQFGFVKFPNPTYSRLTIAITPRMAHRLLKPWDSEERKAIHDAAKEIVRRQTA